MDFLADTMPYLSVCFLSCNMITIEKFQTASINTCVSMFKIVEFMTCKLYEQRSVMERTANTL